MTNVSDFPAEGTIAEPVLAETRPFYWSVRRELWENRALYIAPLVVASVFLFGYLLSTIMLPQRMVRAAALSEGKQREIVTMPYSAASFMLIMTAFLVGAFYCFDALQSERRDRSILFWKSLPVSDGTTVLSKFAIPFFVLPSLVFVLATFLHGAIMAFSTLRLLGHGKELALMWSHMRPFQFAIAFAYGLIVIALWHAPIYAWFLLVSAWSRRVPALWALLPLLAIGGVERMLFGTTTVMKRLGQRVIGGIQHAYVFPPHGANAPKEAIDPLAHLTPLRFLTSPTLWFGLILTVLFLTLAIRLRRNREPV